VTCRPPSYANISVTNSPAIGTAAVWSSIVRSPIHINTHLTVHRHSGSANLALAVSKEVPLTLNRCSAMSRTLPSRSACEFAMPCETHAAASNDVRHLICGETSERVGRNWTAHQYNRMAGAIGLERSPSNRDFQFTLLSRFDSKMRIECQSPHGFTNPRPELARLFTLVRRQGKRSSFRKSAAWCRLELPRHSKWAMLTRRFEPRRHCR